MFKTKKVFKELISLFAVLVPIIALISFVTYLAKGMSIGAIVVANLVVLAAGAILVIIANFTNIGSTPVFFSDIRSKHDDK